MPIFNRGEQQPAAASTKPGSPELGVDDRRLRDETDPDPLVEQAAERLRQALHTLEARDEWGRALAWRQVARIALGPILTQLRDAETAMRLKDAVAPAADADASGDTPETDPSQHLSLPQEPVTPVADAQHEAPASTEQQLGIEQPDHHADQHVDPAPRPTVDPLDSSRPLDELVAADPILADRDHDEHGHGVGDGHGGVRGHEMTADEDMRGHEMPTEDVRGHEMPAEDIRGHEMPAEDVRGHEMRAGGPPTQRSDSPAPWDPRWRPQPWRDQPWQRG
ncbi:MAG TPA: hypothetical protein VFT62_05750 [Mycobacteriales bacterium]|nr:hypothetical protein [Mycobacteriales bacterium]